MSNGILVFIEHRNGVLNKTSLEAIAAAQGLAASLQQPGQPMFRSLFHAGERAQPVSPTVQQLWGNGSSLTSVATANASLSSQTPNVRAPQPLDLFSDRNGTFSG